MGGGFIGTAVRATGAIGIGCRSVAGSGAGGGATSEPAGRMCADRASGGARCTPVSAISCETDFHRLRWPRATSMRSASSSNARSASVVGRARMRDVAASRKLSIRVLSAPAASQASSQAPGAARASPWRATAKALSISAKPAPTP